MSPTLLEGVIAIVLLVVAWQIGLAIAPLIFREWRFMKHSLDDVTDNITTESIADQQAAKEQHHDPQR